MGEIIKRSLSKVFVFIALLSFQCLQVIGQDKPIQIADLIDLQVIGDHGFIGDFKQKGASFVKVHFTNFYIPYGDTVFISNETDTVIYTDFGKEVLNEKGENVGFWSKVIFGDSVHVRWRADGDVSEGGFEINQVSFGYPMNQISELLGVEPAPCGINNRENIECYNGTEMYNRAKSVCKLIIGGGGVCTGWLLGSEGHVMTNNHCISSNAIAADTDFLFNYQLSSCNGTLMPFDVVAESSSLSCATLALDFAVVELPVNPTPKYGYLTLETDLPEIGERVYLPQHPKGEVKQISVYDDQSASGYAEVVGTKDRISFYADSEGGSSGSPLLSYNTHCVVGLHFGGDCPNLAHSSQNILTYIDLYFKGCLPEDAICYKVNNEELSKGNSSMVYPNPSSGPIQIQGVEVVKVSILSQSGALIRDEYTMNFSMDDLPSGTYYLRIEDPLGVEHLSEVKIIR